MANRSIFVAETLFWGGAATPQGGQRAPLRGSRAQPRHAFGSFRRETKGTPGVGRVGPLVGAGAAAPAKAPVAPQAPRCYNKNKILWRCLPCLIARNVSPPSMTSPALDGAPSRSSAHPVGDGGAGLPHPHRRLFHPHRGAGRGAAPRPFRLHPAMPWSTTSGWDWNLNVSTAGFSARRSRSTTA